MIRSEITGGIRVLTLARPEALNAFNTDQFERLAELIVEAADDPGTRVVVLTGEGRAFSAGADLSGTPPARADYKYGFPGMVEVIIDFPKPFIVAANGLGVGVGATILGLADMAFMAESARLRCPFSALGLTAEACSTYTFSRLMGPQKAARFLLGAEWWDAAACKEAGLALDVFPDAEFMDRVMAFARDLAAWPMPSLIETKGLLMAPHREAMHRANREENEALARLRGGAANVEAMKAFREKREPNFANL
ncbi:MAG: enoyl-CoA hydratase/isomerase family protein [Dehalococcoidia bacterium]|nr:enoyl-CoA hydratase/isomerase family protein [Dehalococcoidia bacterium]